MGERLPVPTVAGDMTPEAKAEIIRLRGQGMSVNRVAIKLQLTRGQVAGLWDRHTTGRKNTPTTPTGRPSSRWSEDRLTEKWTDRKARPRAPKPLRGGA